MKKIKALALLALLAISPLSIAAGSGGFPSKPAFTEMRIRGISTIDPSLEGSTFYSPQANYYGILSDAEGFLVSANAYSTGAAWTFYSPFTAGAAYISVTRTTGFRLLTAPAGANPPVFTPKLTCNLDTACTITYSLLSTKPCAAGYTRITPNYCAKNDTSALTGFSDNTCTSVAAPASDAVAVDVVINYAVKSANAVAVRTSTADVYSAAACATRGDTQVQAVMEFVATAAGTTIAQTNAKLRAPAVAGNFIFKSTGNPAAGWPSYVIVGYYD